MERLKTHIALWLSRHILDIAFSIIFVLCVFVMFLTSEYPSVRNSICEFTDALCFKSSHAHLVNGVLYDLSVGSAISLCFYALLIRIPALQRRSLIKRSLRKRYKTFKLSCIEIMLLVADGSYKGGKPEKLVNLKNFRKYFNEPISDSQNRWHGFMNKLYKNEYYLGKLTIEMEIFRDELIYVLYNCDVNDDRILNFLKSLSEEIYMNRNPVLEYDSVKSYAGFLWGIFTGWDPIIGYSDDDIIETMIEKL